MIFLNVVKYIDGLMQEIYKSIANALWLCPSCTNPLVYDMHNIDHDNCNAKI